MRTLIAGIDLGLTSGIAILDPGGDIVLTAMCPFAGGTASKPGDYWPAGMCALIQPFADRLRGAVLEQATVIRVPLRKTGGTMIQAESTADLARCLGIWTGILAAFDVPIRTVLARTWQKAMLAAHGDTKESSIWTAFQVWPNANLTPAPFRSARDGIADALHLAEFGRRGRLFA